MSLRFILGRAGSGKTTYCLNEIKEQLKTSDTNKNLILVVPEQATFQNELELCTTLGLGGIINAQVLSFSPSSLAGLQEVGEGQGQIGDLEQWLSGVLLRNGRMNFRFFPVPMDNRDLLIV